MLHLSGNRDYRYTIYSALIVSILTQEKDPWNINYSVLPITFYGIIGFLLRIYHIKDQIIIYNWNYLCKGLVLTLIGIHFFLKGLDEFDDYLRFNHGMWHLLGGMASFYGFQSV